MTIVERYIQRAPVFHFVGARDKRDFGIWLEANFAGVKSATESTTSVDKLSYIERYSVGAMLYTRMNFTTGGGGAEYVRQGGFSGCQWIADTYQGPLKGYTLFGAIDTGKKHSQLNTLHSRGARVVAEIVLQPEQMQQLMRATTQLIPRAQCLAYGRYAGRYVEQRAARFIATGQDATNVAEGQASISYVDLREDGSLYWLITLPSLIMATFGGGTGLPTQCECLDMMDCVGPENGKGKVGRLLEITAATVLAGELSLSSAIVSGDWVSSHDALGRNR